MTKMTKVKEMKNLNTLIRSIFPALRKKPARQFALLLLPVDLLWMIFPLLPLVSQACLALTCKPLYQILSSVLQHDELAWPRVLANTPYEWFLHTSEPSVRRNALLLQLEDSRWMFCSECLKLHPRSHFKIWSAKVQPRLRRCVFAGGITDLCACLALTFRGRKRLVEWLKTGEPGENLPPALRNFFRLRVRWGRRILEHKCSNSAHQDLFVRLVVNLTLDPGDTLIVTTRYHVQWSRERKYHMYDVSPEAKWLPPINAEPVLFCPHIHAITWLKFGYPWLRNECCCCDTRLHLLHCTPDGLSLVLQAVRNLGGGSVRWGQGARWPESSADSDYRTRHHDQEWRTIYRKYQMGRSWTLAGGL